MFKRKNLHIALVASSALLLSAAASAETTPGSASIIVTNAFSLVETTPIDFGNIQVATDVDNATTGEVTVTIPGNANPMTLANASTPAEANGNILTQGTPGLFNITGAAPFTALTINFPAAFDLTNTTAPPSTPAFEVTLAAATTFVVGGAEDGNVYDAATPNLTTDGTGAVGFNLGGVLTTDATATAVYADGTYSGSYTMEVVY
ncbi:hypothetical protein ACFO4O_06860 [Glaciecola siphonariae]|uniref:DUF4402 domain-containing protein n=1 Tax=Glaciecola siphonariae TaxID=521012 RepID=A0ABV9LUB8_9ALTE